MPIVPDAVEEATENFRESEDWLAAFIQECCETGEDKRTQARVLYLAYKEYATENGDYLRREREFSPAMREKGFRQVSAEGRKHWKGIAPKQTE